MKLYSLLVVATILFLAGVPAVSAAAQAERTITGTVTKLFGNQVMFKTTQAVTYAAETSQAVLMRKNGTPMQYTEFAVGDKVEVYGTVWSDNSMTALRIRDLTLYTHTGTFSGKITQIDTFANTLTLLGSQYGIQTMHISPQTVYLKNRSAATIQDMVVGVTATIKGTWERSRADVVAREVYATARLLNIDITGELVMRNGMALTVVSNGVLYSVDASKAKIKNKNNKSLTITGLDMGGPVRVQGKHTAENTHIVATTVKGLFIGN